MTNLFLKIVNMSISAGWIILAVLLVRILMKKLPKWASCVLWAVVGLRLVIPFSIKSALSLIPSAETISPDIMTDTYPKINIGVPMVDAAINSTLQGSITPSPEMSVNPMQIIVPVLTCLWIVGIAALLLYTSITYLRLKSKVRTAVIVQGNIYQSEYVDSPFIFGIICPKIYLPYNINESDIPHIIAHEQSHLKRGDHFWKPLGFVILSVYWFNPLVWVAYILLCKDIELACDERVTRKFDNTKRADYSQALLSCSIKRRSIAACPVAFGEVGVKDRVKSILSYKKPTLWIIITTAIALCVFTICFLTNPKDNRNASSVADFEYTIIASDGVTIDKYIGNDEYVVIPDKINNMKVTQISYSAFENKGIKSVVIPDSVVYIDNHAFYNCDNLVNVNFGSGVTEIYQNAFMSCDKLKKVVLPSKLEKLYDKVFAYCTSLEEVYIPKTITNFRSSTFIGCTALSKVTFEEGIDGLRGYAIFHGCNIEELNIPKSVNEIDDFFFGSLPSLKSIKTYGDAPITDGEICYVTKPKNITLYYPKDSKGWGYADFSSYTLKSY